MRDRAWRRYTEERIVIKRLRELQHRGWSWYAFKDVNGLSVPNPQPFDYIGKSHSFMYKTYTTCWNDTIHKVKYSPNKSRTYWRDKGGMNTREEHRKEFLSILREYGIK